MKLLHLADLHIGKRVYEYSMLEEQKAGNTEFDSAAKQSMEAMLRRDMPELQWFIDNCLEPFSLNIDQL